MNITGSLYCLALIPLFESCRTINQRLFNEYDLFDDMDTTVTDTTILFYADATGGRDAKGIHE